MKCSNKQCIGGWARRPGSNSDVEYPCLECEGRREAVRRAAPEMLETLTVIRDADEDCKRDGLTRPVTELVRAKIDRVIAKAGGK